MSPAMPTVGTPVEGPSRWTSTMTRGVSVPTANPMFSCIRLMPGPEVAVMDLLPGPGGADGGADRS